MVKHGKERVAGGGDGGYNTVAKRMATSSFSVGLSLVPTSFPSGAMKNRCPVGFPVARPGLQNATPPWGEFGAPWGFP